MLIRSPENAFGDLILYVKERRRVKYGEARTTKDEIVQLLKVKESTVAELADVLEITEMAIRRHLSNLEKMDSFILRW